MIGLMSAPAAATEMPADASEGEAVETAPAPVGEQ